jgi:hypothetical protein
MENNRSQLVAKNRWRKRLLFICGCPRSGTTAMSQLLARHPEACIGRERYATIFNRKQPFRRSLFEKKRFLTLQPGDTFYDITRFQTYHEGFAEKFDACRFVGDKIPYLYTRWDDVFTLRPKPIVIFMIRNVLDVAESYTNRARCLSDPWPVTKNATVAVREWNSSLRFARQAIESGHADQLLFVEYEGFFEQTKRMLGMLSHLELSTDDRDTQHLYGIAAEAVRVHQKKDKIREMTPQQKRHLLLHASVGLYRKLLPRATGWMSADFGRDDDTAVGMNEAA